MTHKMIRNAVIQWRGGGYDGCIWEPNTGFFNAEGEWYPVISTGYNARDTIEDFWRQRANRNPRPYRDEDFIFPITEEGLLDFQTYIREDFFMHTIKVLEDEGYDVWWRCAHCGESICGVDEFVQFQGYQGDGGIGVIHDGPVCEECFSQNQCRGCQDYDSNLDENGMCWHCGTEVFRQYPPDQDENDDRTYDDLIEEAKESWIGRAD